MLKELFEASFYITFPKKEGKKLMLEECIAQGDFGLVDAHACQGCKLVCSDNQEEREQLKVRGEHQISIVSLDQVFSFVGEEVGQICDYMLDSACSIALVEMTCSTGGYVKDKRQKARGQLYNTLALLFSNPLVREHIENRTNRFVVFSWRETIPDDEEMDFVESSMKGMTLMADEVYSSDNESKFDFGFKLVSTQLLFKHSNK